MEDRRNLANTDQGVQTTQKDIEIISGIIKILNFAKNNPFEGAVLQLIDFLKEYNVSKADEFKKENEKINISESERYSNTKATKKIRSLEKIIFTINKSIITRN